MPDNEFGLNDFVDEDLFVRREVDEERFVDNSESLPDDKVPIVELQQRVSEAEVCLRRGQDLGTKRIWLLGNPFKDIMVTGERREGPELEPSCT